MTTWLKEDTAGLTLSTSNPLIVSLSIKVGVSKGGFTHSLSHFSLSFIMFSVIRIHSGTVYHFQTTVLNQKFDNATWPIGLTPYQRHNRNSVPDQYLHS